MGLIYQGTALEELQHIWTQNLIPLSHTFNKHTAWQQDLERMHVPSC